MTRTLGSKVSTGSCVYAWLLNRCTDHIITFAHEGYEDFGCNIFTRE